MAETASQQTPVNQTPVWSPSQARKEGSTLWAFKAYIENKYQQNFSDYHALWTWSNTHSRDFWSEVWDYCGVIGDKGQIILPENQKMVQGAHFFPDSKVNYAENLLRRKDEATAIVFRGEDKVETSLNYKQLYDQVSQFAQGLVALGVKKNSRVCGLMPNMPETIIAALATASIGAIWSSASPDFGVQGVLDRFGQIEPDVMIACAGYYYNGKTHDCLSKISAIQEKIPSLKQVVIVPYAIEKPAVSNAVLYADFISAYTPKDIQFERFDFNHPLFIMFSSGTTGTPKCIVHGHGGTLIQHLKEFHLQCDVKKGDHVFYFTTCGWMMWNWLISGLACEATLLLYDGSPFYPDGNALFDFAQKYKMSLFGTAAKYVDAVKKAGINPAKTHDLSHLITLTSTGSPLVHESFDYILSDIKKDLHICALYGGTDIIAASFGIGNPISPVYRGELQGPGLGTDIDVFDENGQPAPYNVQGDVVCKSVFPSMPVAFWDDPDGSRYKGAYFEGYDGVWTHGDWAEKTPTHGLIVHGRSDATLNPGGVRIGTAEIYRQVEQIEEVLESIAIGQNWDDDVRVILFVRLREGVTLTEELIKTIRTRIRIGASPRHVPEKVIAVSDIPRTKSNKMVELAVRNVVHGKPVKNVEALANPEALELYKDIPELQS
ncbi:MAG: acetoacetate--CoA ligase [Micavibrio sp.]|nr:acetoacetate--CoA ligase [Micavibrio sp.]